MGIIYDILQQLTDFIQAYGVWGLIIASFTESSFFPIPPEVFLIPLALSQPSNAWWFGVLVTASSVLGAILGWWIGRKFGRPLLYRLFAQKRIEKVESYFLRYGGVAIAIGGGFSPIPYKLFTIASGMINIPLRDLLLWSLLGRGARFMLEAYLIVLLGPLAKNVIDKYLGPASLFFVIALLLGYGLYRLFRKKKLN